MAGRPECFVNFPTVHPFYKATRACLDWQDSSDFDDEKGVSATVPKHGAVLLHLTDCQ